MFVVNMLSGFVYSIYVLNLLVFMLTRSFVLKDTTKATQYRSMDYGGSSVSDTCCYITVPIVAHPHANKGTCELLVYVPTK